MIDFFKKYKGFLIGLVILVILIMFLSAIGFIIIDKDEVLTNIVGFLVWWFLISFPIHKFEYLKKQKHVVLKVVGLIVLFIAMIVIGEVMDMPDNPMLMLLLILFWLGIPYLVAPKFFTKHRFFIIGYYALVFCYFLYARLVFGSPDDSLYEQHKSIFITLLLMPIPIVIGLWFYEQWKWFKQFKAEKSKAELAMLKTQINPHFFFNTLNNLHALTVMQSEKAPEVVLKLSDMMRYTIYEGKKDRVPLSDEVSYLENYIELHRIRYHKTVELSFEHSIRETDTVSPLLFIILLENALKHGVESLVEGAFVHMKLTSDEKGIHFSIHNNFDPSEVSDQKGIGLENLRRRLDLTYPDKHLLVLKNEGNEYHADLTIFKS